MRQADVSIKLNFQHNASREIKFLFTAASGSTGVLFHLKTSIKTLDSIKIGLSTYLCTFVAVHHFSFLLSSQCVYCHLVSLPNASVCTLLMHLYLDDVPWLGSHFISSGRSWSHEDVADHWPFPRRRRDTVRTLGLVLERHHFLARLRHRHQTLRHHVRVVRCDWLHLRLLDQMRENGAFRRRQSQVADAAQIKFANTSRYIVVQVVLHESCRPTNGRVSLERARVVVVHV